MVSIQERMDLNALDKQEQSLKADQARQSILSADEAS